MKDEVWKGGAASATPRRPSPPKTLLSDLYWLHFCSATVVDFDSALDKCRLRACVLALPDPFLSDSFLFFQ